MIKKSILDLLVEVTDLGQNVKSFLFGYKALYGSEKSNSLQRLLNSCECLILGLKDIFKQSILSLAKSVETVQFQSPPRITGPSPNLLRDSLRLLNKRDSRE